MRLILLLFLPLAYAGSLNNGNSCSQTNNRLQSGTFQFWDQCDSVTFCSESGICKPKGCRKDEYPFGYPQDSKSIPNKCPTGQFCPDEQDQCLPLLAVGSPCQLNRDGKLLFYSGLHVSEGRSRPVRRSLELPAAERPDWSGTKCQWLRLSQQYLHVRFLLCPTSFLPPTYCVLGGQIRRLVRNA